MDTKNIENVIKQQTRLFIESFPKRFEEIETDFEKLKIDLQNNLLWKELHRHFHSFSGAAGIFKFSEIHDLAKTIENEFMKIISQELAIDNNFIQWVEESYRRFKLLTNRINFETVTFTNEPIISLSLNESAQFIIFLMGDDIDYLENLQKQIQYYGYTVRIVPNCNAMQNALANESPHLILSEAFSVASSTCDPKEILSNLFKYHSTAKIAFFSSDDSLPLRITCAETGGIAFFKKPLEIGHLIDLIETLIVRPNTEAYRVAIVDDDIHSLEIMCTILEEAGFSTTALRNPLSVVKVLEEFRPDVILLDLFMKECNGKHLARALRQMEQFMRIPIIFVSNSTSAQTKLETLEYGGEGFIEKPIVPTVLIKTVLSKISRAKQFIKHIDHESLTGLYNHTALKELLKREKERSLRQATKFAYIMIDVDHFKSVNDTYGHLIGDQILKALAGFLRAHLRNTDILGRYGGEEFGIIMLDASVEQAVQVIDKLRSKFEKIIHHSATKNFSVTFSAGVSSCNLKDENAIIQRADELLYKAKNEGRNRVFGE